MSQGSTFQIATLVPTVLFTLITFWSHLDQKHKKAQQVYIQCTVYRILQMPVLEKTVA